MTHTIVEVASVDGAILKDKLFDKVQPACNCYSFKVTEEWVASKLKLTWRSVCTFEAFLLSSRHLTVPIGIA